MTCRHAHVVQFHPAAQREIIKVAMKVNAIVIAIAVVIVMAHVVEWDVSNCVSILRTESPAQQHEGEQESKNWQKTRG